MNKTNQNDTKQCKYGCKGNEISPMYGCPIHGEQVASQEKCWDTCDCECHNETIPPPATEGKEEWSKEFEDEICCGGDFCEGTTAHNKYVMDLIHKTLQAQAEEIFKDLERSRSIMTSVTGSTVKIVYPYKIEKLKSKYLTKE